MPPKKSSKKTSKPSSTRKNVPKQPAPADPAPSAVLRALDRREESEGSSEDDNMGKLAGSGFEDSSNDDSDSQVQQEQDSTRSAAGADEESDEDTLITIPQKRANKTTASKQPKSFFSHLHVPVELTTEY